MQPSAAQGDGRIDGKDPVCKGRDDLLPEPVPQYLALPFISTFDQENANLDFLERYRGDEEIAAIDIVGP